MKKLMVMFMLMLATFGLASCSDDEQKVTVTDDEGKKVEVVLKPSEEEEVVKNAIRYAAQADYEATKGGMLKVKASLTSNIDEEFANASLSAEVAFNEEKAYANVTGDMNVKYNVMNPETEKEELVEEKLSATASAYLEQLESVFYLDASVTENDVKNSLKYKMDLSDLAGSLNPMLPVRSKKMSDIQISLTPDQILASIKLVLPKTKIVVSSVDKNQFTLQAQISVNDLIKLSNSSGNQEHIAQLENDFNVLVDFSFNISDGKFAKFAFETNNKLLLTLLGEEVNESTSASLKLALTVDASYGNDVDVKTLTEAEKAEFLPFNPEQ